jgi:two-component sensor histidine kinase
MLTQHALQEWELIELLDDVCLCVSELATNALLHGTLPGQEFTLTLARTADMLRVEVHDRSESEPRLRQVTVDDCSGRGWLVIRELAHDHGVIKNESQKMVWLTFKIPRSSSM